MKQSIEDRFWPKVDKSGGPDSCWPWTKGRHRNGYGKFYSAGKHISAHRTAFLFSAGTIPEGLHVLHKCDNRACCNPRHLFAGTSADNMADKVSKNRQSRTGFPGEKHGRSKLSNRPVLVLKKLRSLGWKLRTLATFFGISLNYADKVCLGKSRLRG